MYRIASWVAKCRQKLLFLIFLRLFSIRQTYLGTRKVEINNKLNQKTYKTVVSDLFCFVVHLISLNPPKLLQRFHIVTQNQSYRCKNWYKTALFGPLPYFHPGSYTQTSDWETLSLEKGNFYLLLLRLSPNKWICAQHVTNCHHSRIFKYPVVRKKQRWRTQ